MGLNDFTVKEARPLPVLILADVSGSMQGEKIKLLNTSIREMVSSLASIDDVRGRFQVGIVTFGEEVKIHQHLANVDTIKLTEMNAAGKTPMGEAFGVITSIIEDKNQISSRAYTPTIVLVSDGLPTDYYGSSNSTVNEYLEWEALKLLHTSPRASKCLRLAMGIGTDADINMLKAFINNPTVPVIQSKDATGISNFFKWVTMSTLSRMSSADPNAPISMLPVGFEQDEIIL
ncbi:MAG: VWA domain-containing protein [Clostridia bacterium]|jgi:uncharacterized protein YegL|nr:VWA domain-containing protein [Clostridia bacterium]